MKEDYISTREIHKQLYSTQLNNIRLSLQQLCQDNTIGIIFINSDNVIHNLKQYLHLFDQLLKSEQA